MDQWLLYYKNNVFVENHEYMILRAICISQPFKKPVWNQWTSGWLDTFTAVKSLLLNAMVRLGVIKIIPRCLNKKPVYRQTNVLFRLLYSLFCIQTLTSFVFPRHKANLLFSLHWVIKKYNLIPLTTLPK